MLKKIGQKLNSKNGASILFGLLMLLVAALVSTIIISAALTSAKVSSRDYKDQQAYLTVSSATELMKTKIDGSTWRKEIIIDGQGNEEVVVEKEGEFCDWLAEGVDYINNNQGISSYTKNLNITAGDLETVRAKLEMDRNYNITITFTLDDSKDRVSPAMVLTTNASVSEGGEYEGTDAEGNVIYITELQKLSWDNGLITPSMPSKSGD